MDKRLTSYIKDSLRKNNIYSRDNVKELSYYCTKSYMNYKKDDVYEDEDIKENFKRPNKYRYVKNLSLLVFLSTLLFVVGSLSANFLETTLPGMFMLNSVLWIGITFGCLLNLIINMRNRRWYEFLFTLAYLAFYAFIFYRLLTIENYNPVKYVHALGVGSLFLTIVTSILGRARVKDKWFEGKKFLECTVNSFCDIRRKDVSYKYLNDPRRYRRVLLTVLLTAFLMIVEVVIFQSLSYIYGFIILVLNCFALFMLLISSLLTRKVRWFEALTMLALLGTFVYTTYSCGMMYLKFDDLAKFVIQDTIFLVGLNSSKEVLVSTIYLTPCVIGVFAYFYIVLGIKYKYRVSLAKKDK